MILSDDNNNTGYAIKFAHGFALVWIMMASSNGSIFRFTGPLRGESTGHRLIPLTKASDAELWCFLWSSWTNGRANNGDAGDLKRHRAHYDVTVIITFVMSLFLVISCELFTYIIQNWFNGINFPGGVSQLLESFRNVFSCVLYWVWVRSSATQPQQIMAQRKHDDVIKWKHFPRNWPFVRGIHRSRWIPHTKASDAELWCFIWSASE